MGVGEGARARARTRDSSEKRGRERGGGVERNIGNLCYARARGKIKRFIKQTSIPYYPAPRPDVGSRERECLERDSRAFPPLPEDKGTPARPIGA